MHDYILDRISTLHQTPHPIAAQTIEVFLGYAHDLPAITHSTSACIDHYVPSHHLDATEGLGAI
jgi:hypothetical protein